jgi:hypothetical protein
VKPVQRARLRWLDEVEAAIKTVSINKWRLKVQDKKEWILGNSKGG